MRPSFGSFFLFFYFELTTVGEGAVYVFLKIQNSFYFSKTLPPI